MEKCPYKKNRMITKERLEIDVDGNYREKIIVNEDFEECDSSCRAYTNYNPGCKLFREAVIK